MFFEGNDLKDVWRYREFVERWPNSVSNYFSSRERLFTKNAFEQLRLGLRSREESPDFSRSGVFRTAHGTTRLWFGYAGSELSPQDLAALDVTVASLEDAYALCQKQGIALIVVYAPTKFRVYADSCQFEEKSVIQNWTVNELPQRLRDRVLKISEAIKFLDLTPEFRNAAGKGALLYYADDTHWSPQGHELAARSISEVLRQSRISSD